MIILFITEDNIPIHYGDIFWNVDLKGNLRDFQITNDKYPLEFLKDGSKQFLSKEKAEKYVKTIIT